MLQEDYNREAGRLSYLNNIIMVFCMGAGVVSRASLARETRTGGSAHAQCTARVPIVVRATSDLRTSGVISLLVAWIYMPKRV